MNEFEYSECINSLEDYIDKLKRLSEENPEEAKRIARQDLIRTGIIDDEGNLKYPYNGAKDGSFSRGPQYDYQADKPQTVAELVGEINNKTQKRIRK